MTKETASKVLKFLKEEYESGRFEEYEYVLGQKKHFVRDGFHFSYDWDGCEMCVYSKEEKSYFEFEPYYLIADDEYIKKVFGCDYGFVEVLRSNLSRSEWNKMEEE